MGIFSLSGAVELEQASESPGFNTDSIFDFMSGSFTRGVDGKFYCRGGLSSGIEALLGRPGQYKSTFNASLAMRMCSIYQTELIIFDSEITIIKDKERILRMAGDHAGVLSEENIIGLDAKNKYDLEAMRDLIEEMGEK